MRNNTALVLKSDDRYNPTIGKLGKLGKLGKSSPDEPDGVIGERA